MFCPGPLSPVSTNYGADNNTLLGPAVETSTLMSARTGDTDMAGLSRLGWSEASVMPPKRSNSGKGRITVSILDSR